MGSGEMELFPAGSSVNLLPEDGSVRYFGTILERGGTELMARLLEETPWAPDELVMFGKRITTKREVAWMGDEGFCYRYSGTEKVAAPWSPAVQESRELIEAKLERSFNSCLLNLYHDGGEGMGWHSDDEPELEPDAPIASLSLGAERRFRFRHKESRRTVDVVLEPGSLLVMEGETQRFWQHSLPKTTKVKEPRVNLTFRVFRRPG